MGNSFRRKVIKGRRSHKTVIAILVTLFFAVACSSEPLKTPIAPDSSDPGVTSSPNQATAKASDLSNPLPIVDPTKLVGDIIIAGSSTVFPLAERMAERFTNEGYPGNLTIDSIGSGAGFERFCVTGEIDISNASRPINDNERENCSDIGRKPIEFRIGTDALAVVVNKENFFVTDLSIEQLNLIFSTATFWSEINPDWPNEPIQRFIPGTDSGTFDYFLEAIFDKNKEPILNAQGVQKSEDDNVLIQGVLGSPFAIGFFGYAFYAENEDELNILSIETITASKENVNNNTYPLARPLYIYTDSFILQSKPQVAGYINFLLTYVNEEIDQVGYFPANSDVLEQARNLWLAALDEAQ
ncbi:MAG: PstS family phosphate ABC transporter substrate-binding protein [Chloroflexota bacterium]